jgi:hypothetical protein
MARNHSARACPHVVNLHLEFLRRTSAGPVIFTVKDVKLGQRISNLHITLAQRKDADGANVGPYQDEAEGYITMSNIVTEQGLSLDTGYTLFPQPLPADFELLASQSQDANYIHRGNDPFPSFRRAAQNVQIFVVKPSRKAPADASKGRPRALIEQWIRFTPKTPRYNSGTVGRWTNDALGFLVDMFPQVVETYINPDVEEAAVGNLSRTELKQFLTSGEPRAAFWYPTLNLNLEVKKLLPEEGVEWLFVRVRAKAIRNGRFDLDIEVWDQDGEMVANSVHASLIVDASRNFARSDSSKQQKKDSKL